MPQMYVPDRTNPKCHLDIDKKKSDILLIFLTLLNFRLLLVEEWISCNPVLINYLAIILFITVSLLVLFETEQ